MPRPKYKYVMDFIPDKAVYKAVMFATMMIRDGTAPAVAIRRAAYYYEVNYSDVAHYVGQRAGRKRAEKED